MATWTSLFRQLYDCGKVVIQPSTGPKAFGRQAAKAGIHLAEVAPCFRGGDDGGDLCFHAWGMGHIGTLSPACGL